MVNPTQHGSEPNAQNSEINPIAHPSGARIEKMYQEANDKQGPTDVAEGDRDEIDQMIEHSHQERTSVDAEIKRPSEEEDPIVTDEELQNLQRGQRGQSTQRISQTGSSRDTGTHRMDSNDRENR